MGTNLEGADSLTAMSVPEEGPERLIYFVKQRLADLGMTQEEFAALGGPDRSTLGKMRIRGNIPSVELLRRYDDGLGWEPGSCAVILLGGVPVEAGTITTAGPITADKKVLRLVRQANRRSAKLQRALTEAQTELTHLDRQLTAALGTDV